MSNSQISHDVSHHSEQPRRQRFSAHIAFGARSNATRRRYHLPSTRVYAPSLKCHHPSRCAPVWLRSHHAPQWWRSGRVTDASAACWLPHTESLQCATRLFLLFPRLRNTYPLLGPASTVSSAMVIWTRSRFAQPYASVSLTLSGISISSSAVRVSGRSDSDE